MGQRDATALLDFGDYPTIYSDGIGEIQEAGGTARLSQFIWRKIDGVWRPVVIAVIVRPRMTLMENAHTAMHVALHSAPEATFMASTLN